MERQIKQSRITDRGGNRGNVGRIQEISEQGKVRDVSRTQSEKSNDPRRIHQYIGETNRFIEEPNKFSANTDRGIAEIQKLNEIFPTKQRALGKEMGRGERASISLEERIRKFRDRVKLFATKVREELKQRLQRVQEKKIIEEPPRRIYRPKPRGRGRLKKSQLFLTGVFHLCFVLERRPKMRNEEAF